VTIGGRPKVAASTVWEILKEAGMDPAVERVASTSGLTSCSLDQFCGFG
jgi:hypothetical protein